MQSVIHKCHIAVNGICTSTSLECKRKVTDLLNNLAARRHELLNLLPKDQSIIFSSGMVSFAPLHHCICWLFFQSITLLLLSTSSVWWCKLQCLLMFLFPWSLVLAGMMVTLLWAWWTSWCSTHWTPVGQVFWHHLNKTLLLISPAFELPYQGSIWRPKLQYTLYVLHAIAPTSLILSMEVLFPNILPTVPTSPILLLTNAQSLW